MQCTTVKVASLLTTLTCLSLSSSFSHAEDCNHFCPTLYWGEWNAVHWYTGQECEDDPENPPACRGYGFYAADSSEFVAPGNGCDDPGGCSMRATASVPTPVPTDSPLVAQDDEDRPFPKPVLPGFVPRRTPGGAPGDSQNPNGRFKAGSGVSALADEVVKLTSESGEQYFRVLRLEREIEAVSGTGKAKTKVTMYVGLEIQKSQAGPASKIISADDWVITEGDPKQAKVYVSVNALAPPIEILVRSFVDVVAP